jgi:hypothetical protein
MMSPSPRAARRTTARRSAELTWSQLTRPFTVERRKIKGTDIPANRRGRVRPPTPPEEWEPCRYFSFDRDPFHTDETCKRGHHD